MPNSFGSETRDLWRSEEHAYSAITAPGGSEMSERKGLSHAQAMTLAEQLRRDGNTVIVKRIVGDKSYEVDRYPAAVPALIVPRPARV
jgi:hypothetical protein